VSTIPHFCNIFYYVFSQNTSSQVSAPVVVLRLPLHLYSLLVLAFITTRNELQKVQFLAQSVCGVCLCMNYLGELLSGFAANVWSLIRMSLKVNGQGHQGQNGIFGPFGGLHVVYVW